MTCQLSVPAKTFILGEYLVLRGGLAVVLTSNPSFMLNISEVKDKNPACYEGIHSASPAGNFINQHKHFFDNYALEFIDPYQGIGGLGASSAQFALVYAFKMRLKNLVTSEELAQVIDAYLHCAWNGEGIAPSGADVLTQLKGGLCLFHPAKQRLTNLPWPFRTLDYCLIHTNNKVATHHHLQRLNEIDVSGLDTIVEDAVVALERKDEELFANSIRKYRASLQKKQLVLNETQMILNQIDAQPGVLAAKGCGALGADIIFVLLESESHESFRAWCLDTHLRVIYSGQNLANGLKWDGIDS